MNCVTADRNKLCENFLEHLKKKHLRKREKLVSTVMKTESIFNLIKSSSWWIESVKLLSAVRVKSSWKYARKATSFSSNHSKQNYVRFVMQFSVSRHVFNRRFEVKVSNLSYENCWVKLRKTFEMKVSNGILMRYDEAIEVIEVSKDGD
jgi:hypothetical protein